MLTPLASFTSGVRCSAPDLYGIMGLELPKNANPICGVTISKIGRTAYIFPSCTRLKAYSVNG